MVMGKIVKGLAILTAFYFAVLTGCDKKTQLPEQQIKPNISQIQEKEKSRTIEEVIQPQKSEVLTEFETYINEITSIQSKKTGKRIFDEEQANEFYKKDLSPTQIKEVMDVLLDYETKSSIKKCEFIDFFEKDIEIPKIKNFVEKLKVDIDLNEILYYLTKEDKIDVDFINKLAEKKNEKTGERIFHSYFIKLLSKKELKSDHILDYTNKAIEIFRKYTKDNKRVLHYNIHAGITNLLKNSVPIEVVENTARILKENNSSLFDADDMLRIHSHKFSETYLRKAIKKMTSIEHLISFYDEIDGKEVNDKRLFDEKTAAILLGEGVSLERIEEIANIKDVEGWDSDEESVFLHDPLRINKYLCAQKTGFSIVKIERHNVNLHNLLISDLSVEEIKKRYWERRNLKYNNKNLLSIETAAETVLMPFDFVKGIANIKDTEGKAVYDDTFAHSIDDLWNYFGRCEKKEKIEESIEKIKNYTQEVQKTLKEKRKRFRFGDYYIATLIVEDMPLDHVKKWIADYDFHIIDKEMMKLMINKYRRKK